MVDPKRSAAAKKAAATRKANKAAAASPFFFAKPEQPKKKQAKKRKTPQVGGSWETIRMTPVMSQSVYSKLKPAEHEARQAESVRRADARVLRAYAKTRKSRPSPRARSFLDASVKRQQETVKAEYTARGLKYKAPQKRKKGRSKVQDEATAKQLYAAARQENATFRARQLYQVAVEKHHRGQISAEDLQRAKRRIERTQHADWIRLLRSQGLSKYAKSIKAPAKG